MRAPLSVGKQLLHLVLLQLSNNCIVASIGNEYTKFVGLILRAKITFIETIFFSNSFILKRHFLISSLNNNNCIDNIVICGRT